MNTGVNPVPPAPLALVTGASRGIGREVASRLARDGYTVTVSARTAESLQPIAEELSAAGNRVAVCAADMGRPSDLDRLVEFQKGLDDHLDVLALCAGIGSAGHIEQYPLARVERQLAVNFLAPFRLVQALLPLLRAAASRSADRGAKIVAIASLTGVAGEEQLAAYGASKAALISLCESVTIEEAGSGVTASAVSPGFVNTDMSAWMRERLPAKEMITTGDVAEIVLALCRLSRHVAVPNVVMTRPGPLLWRA